MALIEYCVLVLWGAQCDEAAAAIFVTSLRAAGLRVWLVGVSGGRTAGGHGLRLQPDLMPQQALSLASHTSCVVIPCTDPLLARFINDPTVAALLTHTQRVGARFVVSPALAQWAQMYPEQAHLQDTEAYPLGDGLFHFAATLATMLATKGREDVV